MAWFLPFVFSVASVGITLLYPAWGSINAIESRGSADDTQWLVYWLVYAVFNLIETPLWIVFKWVPGYSLLRVAFFAWLVLPQTKGATFVYEAVLSPIVKILRKQIAQNPTLDRALNRTGQTAGATGQKLNNAMNNAAGNASSYAQGGSNASYTQSGANPSYGGSAGNSPYGQPR